jgi:hypothetical protein
VKEETIVAQLKLAQDAITTAYRYLDPSDPNPVRLEVSDSLGPIRERLVGLLDDLGALIRQQGGAV